MHRLLPKPVIMTRRALSPPSIHPPFARYSHGIAVPAGHRLVVTSGQLGITADGVIPPDAEAQADLCFAAIAAILRSEEHTSELQSLRHLVCRLLLEKKK